MKKNTAFGPTFAAIALMTVTLIFATSLMAAQAAQSPQTTPTASTAIATPASDDSNSIASAHQDQFGHTSRLQAHASIQQPANPQEASKHIAGVKYDDPMSPSNGASSGQLDAKGTQEETLSSNSSGTATPNGMTIKENRLSSNPATRLHQ